MLNIKTFYNMAYRHGQNLYYQRVNDYHIFTNSQLVVAIKAGTNEKLYNELSEGITHRGNFNPTVMVGITEMFEKTYDTEESNINSVYKADKNYTLMDSDDGKITWFASRLLACISKRYKGGKEFVKNTPTPRHETFRIYYKGDKDLFVAILPVCALNNDGVVFRK